jgi:hypothetical protein
MPLKIPPAAAPGDGVDLRVVEKNDRYYNGSRAGGSTAIPAGELEIDN